METRVLLREGSSIRENTFSYDKEISMEKELLYEVIRRSSIVETRVLLREGSSIRENTFSYDKEIFMEKELLYEAKLSL